MKLCCNLTVKLRHDIIVSLTHTINGDVNLAQKEKAASHARSSFTVIKGIKDPVEVGF